MAEDDIYNNKGRYEYFIDNLDSYTIEPKNLLEKELAKDEPNKKRLRTLRTRKYWVKNKENIEYFKRLDASFRARDISYIRRLRVFNTLLLICYLTSKNLNKLDRDDINLVVANMRELQKTPTSHKEFIKNLKNIWKIILPELDEKGRIDETLTPYPVRHLSCKIDKSRQKLRSDRLNEEEVNMLLQYFSKDIRIQAFLSIIYFGVSRPQETLYCKIKDWKDEDNCGKLYISEHGKEGTGFIEILDAYPYLVQWLQKHPTRNIPESYIFLSYIRKNKGMYGRLNPATINKKIKQACKELNINKPISIYSLKRNGVTNSLLNGESPHRIMHRARWTSTKQLKTYDISSHHESYERELAERGLKKNKTKYKLTAQKCIFCNTLNKPNETHCRRCLRLLNRDELKAEMEKIELLKSLDLDTFQRMTDTLKKLHSLED